MTIEKISKIIKADLVKIARERKKITPKNYASCENETLRNYLATRQHTLTEVLNLFCTKNKNY